MEPSDQTRQVAVAVLASDASYDEFCSYVRGIREDVHDDELEDLWEWRLKLLTLRVDTGSGWRSRALGADEQHLSKREVDEKRFAEAKSQGRNIERLPEKAMF